MTVSCLWSYSSRFSFNSRFNFFQLLVSITNDRFTRFQQFVITIPLLSHQIHIKVFYPQWLWCCGLVWICPLLLHFELSNNPLFITCHNSMQKSFLFCIASKISQMAFRLSMSLTFSSCGTYFPLFWIFLNACRRSKMVTLAIFNVWVDSRSITLANLHFQFFCRPGRPLFFISKSPLWKRLNQHSKSFGLNDKLQPTVDNFQQSFPSNEERLFNFPTKLFSWYK